MANRFTSFVSGLFSRLIKDKAGNVAMTFGLSMMPLLFAVGAAVDLTKASAVQQKLAGTADAVALAAARSYKDVNGPKRRWRPVPECQHERVWRRGHDHRYRRRLRRRGGNRHRFTRR